jgi:hypothetical protein
MFGRVIWAKKNAKNLENPEFSVCEKCQFCSWRPRPPTAKLGQKLAVSDQFSQTDLPVICPVFSQFSPSFLNHEQH